MKIAEVNTLLGIVKEFVPNYEITQSRVKSWYKILAHKMTFEEAEGYFYKHFEKSKFIPLPVDILDKHREAFDPDKLTPIDPPDMGGDVNA